MKKIVIAGALIGSMFSASDVFASEYTVQSGDTLWGISNKQDVSVSDIKSLNGLSSNIIYPGQVLKITEEKAVSTSKTSTYKVKSGDSLSKIAAAHNTTTAKLLSLNPSIKNANLISVGQVITVQSITVKPSTGTTTKPTTTTTATKHTVKSGETLSGIASKYDLTLSEILSFNPTISNASSISVGQVINLKQQTTKNWEDVADAIIADAKKHLGKPYLYGASPNTTSAFDCSSFTQRVYGENGISLPRTSSTQANTGKVISLSEVRKGDLLFFATGSNGAISHVSIAMDGSKTVIHAATSKGVSIADTKSYWMPRFVKAVRVIN